MRANRCRFGRHLNWQSTGLNTRSQDETAYAVTAKATGVLRQCCERMFKP
jgi:hypothetical protein